MKKVKYRHSTSRLLLLSVAFFISFSVLGIAQEEASQDAAAESQEQTDESSEEASAMSDLGDPANGKSLFNSLCAACHKPYSASIGPALHGVTEKRDMDWLYRWIKNSQELIASGDDEAVAIYEEYNQTAMPAFPQLSDADIDDILAYVEQPKPEPKVAQTEGGVLPGNLLVEVSLLM